MAYRRASDRSTLATADALSDEALVARSCRDPKAFALVVSRHSDRLYRYLQYRLSPEDAEEALSAVWEAAFRRRASFSPERGTVVGWLYGIARHGVMHARRRAGQRTKLVERMRTLRPGGRTAEDPALHVVGRGSVEAAFRSLSPMDAEVVVLVVWEGLSYAEAAEAVGIPIGTVRSRLARARRQLHAAMDRPN